MRVVRCELLRFHLPFKRSFSHASAERTGADSIGVMLEDEGGRLGFGEILARPYVSGESNDEVFSKGAPSFAAELRERRFDSAGSVVDAMERELLCERWGPALLGGFEAALMNLSEQNHGFDLGRVFGSRRTTTPSRCLTVGFETSQEELRKRARLALLSNAGVIKMKVGRADDAERVTTVAAAVGGKVEIRLDANSALGFDQAVALLEECRKLPISSLEQPFPKSAPELPEALERLHGISGVPLVADESVCTIRDAERWARSGGYQIFNVRVGKCGVLGTAAIMRLARERGIGVVAGTMVGEAAVLNRASEVLLMYSEDLRYVEGLGQNRTLLEADPYERTPDFPGEWPPDWRGDAVFRLRPDIVEACLTARQCIE